MDFVTPFLNYIKQCDIISGNKLYLNAVKVEKDAKQIVTSQIDRSADKSFCDGSVLHKIIFTIFDYKSISFNQLLKTAMERNENLETLLDVQDIVDWISDQESSKNYPDFGSDYKVEKIQSAYLTPTTPTFDSNAPDIAKYSIPIECYVMDYTEAIQ